MAGRPTRGSLLGMVGKRARPLPVDALLCPANLASSNVVLLDATVHPPGSRASSGHSDVGGGADQRRVRVDARRMSSPLCSPLYGTPSEALQQPTSLPLPGAPPDMQVRP